MTAHLVDNTTRPLSNKAGDTAQLLNSRAVKPRLYVLRIAARYFGNRSVEDCVGVLGKLLPSEGTQVVLSSPNNVRVNAPRNRNLKDYGQCILVPHRVLAEQVNEPPLVDATRTR